jgi:hypothetical protein
MRTGIVFIAMILLAVTSAAAESAKIICFWASREGNSRSVILRARAREKASAHAKCALSGARSFETLLI